MAITYNVGKWALWARFGHYKPGVQSTCSMYSVVLLLTSGVKYWAFLESIICNRVEWIHDRLSFIPISFCVYCLMNVSRLLTHDCKVTVCLHYSWVLQSVCDLTGMKSFSFSNLSSLLFLLLPKNCKSIYLSHCSSGSLVPLQYFISVLTC